MTEAEVDLSIDVDRIQDALIEQPSLYMKYTEKLAAAEARADAADLNLRAYEAENMNSGFNGEFEDLKKSSVEAVQAYVRSTKQYRILKESAMEARREASYLTNILFALQHRRNSIDALARRLSISDDEAPTTKGVRPRRRNA